MAQTLTERLQALYQEPRMEGGEYIGPTSPTEQQLAPLIASDPTLKNIYSLSQGAARPDLLLPTVAAYEQLPENLRTPAGTPDETLNALIGYRAARPVANNDQIFLALQASPAYQSLPEEYKQAFHGNITGWMNRNQTSGGSFLGDLGLPEPSLNPLQQAKNIVKQDQQNVGKAIETLQPVANVVLQNAINPVAKVDEKIAKATGSDWAKHMTGKTRQTFERTSDKAAGFQELFEKSLADKMQSGRTLTPGEANKARLEADRAHVRTNSSENIRAGIERGEYKVQGNDVVDRYGNSVLGKGLAQRGTTALQAVSVVMPALAPLAAAATTATAARHGTPVGKAVAQGIGSYYAGTLGAGMSPMAQGAIQGGTQGALSAYGRGERGSDLFKEAAEGAAIGGITGGIRQLSPSATNWLKTQGVSPELAAAITRGGGSAIGAGLRGGDVGTAFAGGALGSLGGEYGKELGGKFGGAVGSALGGALGSGGDTTGALLRGAASGAGGALKDAGYGWAAGAPTQALSAYQQMQARKRQQQQQLAAQRAAALRRRA